MINQEKLIQIKELIDKNITFLVVIGANIDWDSYGCWLAMTLFLKKIGKDVYFICDEELPENYDQIWFSELMKKTFPKDSQIDVIFTFDTPNFELFKNAYLENQFLFQRIPVVNIDHHVSNTNYANINIVEEASSAAEILYKIIDWIWKRHLIDNNIATAIYFGMINDTNNFKHSVLVDTLSVAWELIKLWADYKKVVTSYFRSYRFEVIKIYWEVLANLQIYKDWVVCWWVITQKMMQKYWLDEETTQTWVLKNELIPSIKSTGYTFLIKEMIDWSYSISLRSKDPKYDMNLLASQLWWWGHKMAAWAKSSKALNYIIDLITNFY